MYFERQTFHRLEAACFILPEKLRSTRKHTVPRESFLHCLLIMQSATLCQVATWSEEQFDAAESTNETPSSTYDTFASNIHIK
jgi:hypothetical protein